MKAALALAALVSTSAFAQLPPLPGVPSLPALPGLPAGGGSTTITVNGIGATVTVDTTQTPPVAVEPIGLPALPGL